MAISTYGVYLHYKGKGSNPTPASLTQLIDIKDFPDLGGEPEMLETTTLSDDMQTYIPGIQNLEALTFTCNYDVDDFKKLRAMKDKEYDFAVLFGDSGVNGKFEFSGKLSVYPVGGGVNEVVDMAVTIAPSTPITFSAN